MVLAVASEPAEARTKKPKVDHHHAKQDEPKPYVWMTPLPAEWPRQLPQQHETYYFYPYTANEPDKGAEAFLGIGADLWVAVFTLALVLATGVQAVLILRAENLTRAALRVSQRQAVQAKIDGARHAEENAKALAAAHQANEIAREMGRAQARAYLVIFDAEMLTYTTHGFPCEVFIWVRNTGQTPCRWIEVESNARLVGKQTTATDVPLDPSGETRRWPMDVSKERRFRCRPVCFPCIQGQRPKLTDLMKEARDLDKILVVQGTLRWETIFGEIFESTFFFWSKYSSPETKSDGQGGYVDVPEKMTHPPVECPTYRKVRGADSDDT